MSRIIAIDYGKKRTGLAISDHLKIIAIPFTTVLSCKIIMYLKNYTKINEVDLFILGKSRQMNYSYSENMQKTEKFRKNLQKAIPNINIQMIDERFTSVLAHQAMIEGGIKKMQRRNKELVNKLSAAFLLQTYLEFKKK